jgi:hypothetical protein
MASVLFSILPSTASLPAYLVFRPVTFLADSATAAAGASRAATAAAIRACVWTGREGEGRERARGKG